jgi:Tfp pilus assembly protein PilO
MDRSLRRNTLILVSSLAAILIIYLVAYLIPHRNQAQQLRVAIRQKQSEIDRCKAAEGQRVMVNADLALLETATRRAAEQLPPALNVKEFLATVHSLGHQADLTISNVTPGIVTDLVGVQQQPIGLTLVGRFRSIMKLVYELEQMGRLVELSDLDMRSLEKAGQREDMLEVKVTVRLFARPPKGPPASNAPGLAPGV